MSNFLFNLKGTITQEQTQQAITATYNLGTIRGKGSSTRIFTNCMTETKDNYDDCLNLVATGELLPELPINGLLFDIESFNSLFSIKSGFRPVGTPFPISDYKPIDPIIKKALLEAAGRWSKFLEFTPEMVTFIRNSDLSKKVKSLKRWKGLYLWTYFIKKYNDPDILASASYVPIETGTTANYYFTLTISSDLIKNGELTVPYSYFLDTLTHELGHALGMPISISRVNGTGKELLPNIQNGGKLANDAFYEANPSVYLSPYYKKAVDAYNRLGGWVYNVNPPANPKPINKYLPLKIEDFPNTHWRNDNILGLENGQITTNYFYRGFYNEIMISVIPEDARLYISQVTIGALLDLYTSWNENIIYNYKHKGGNENSDYKYRDDDTIEFT